MYLIEIQPRPDEAKRQIIVNYKKNENEGGKYGQMSQIEVHPPPARETAVLQVTSLFGFRGGYMYFYLRKLYDKPVIS